MYLFSVSLMPCRSAPVDTPSARLNRFKAVDVSETPPWNMMRPKACRCDVSGLFNRLESDCVIVVSGVGVEIGRSERQDRRGSDVALP